jgi:hypothetical protein
MLSRKQFSQYVYRHYFGEDSPAACASLSRTYRRLEDRGLLIRKKGNWMLTQEMGDDNGLLVAICELGELVDEAHAKGEIHAYVKEAVLAVQELLPNTLS